MAGKKISLEPFVFKHFKHGELEKKIKLSENARRDAIARIPSGAEGQPTETELEGIAEVNSHLTNEISNASTWSLEVSHAINNNRMEFGENSFSNLGNEFRSSLDSILAGKEEDFRNLKDRISTSENDLRTFKMEHNLTRDPKVRPKWLKIASYLVPIVFICIETYYNGTVFADAMQGGINEGLALALGISVVNVLTSFFIGMMLPWLWYKKVSFRIFGSFFVILWLSVISYVNFLFGVFRSKGLGPEASGGFTDSSQMANAFLVGNPFTQLDQLTTNGTLFIFVCFIFAILSLLDGLFKNDTYKGYGEVGEKLENAKNALAVERSSLTNALLNEQDSSFKKIEVLEKKVKETIQVWRSSINLLQEFKRDYESLLKNLSSSAEHCVNQYISINRSYREPNLGEPTYWQNPRESFNTSLEIDENSFENKFNSLQGEYMDDAEAEIILISAMDNQTDFANSARNEIVEIYEEYIEMRNNLL